jgi:multidrug efflux pump subunit AcrA (membrane-fusion protein)
MDIIKQTKKPFYKNRSFVTTAGIIALTAFLIASTQMNISAFSVQSNSVITAVVEQGDFDIKISGPGILAPRDVRWVASTVSGKVERILVKPGAQVEKGQLIVELVNPELDQMVEELHWEVEAMQAQTRALKVSQDTQLLDMQAKALATQMKYEKAKMRLDAESQLIKVGNSTVSKLDFESSKLTVNQLGKTIEINKLRAKQLVLNLAAGFEAQTALLKKLNKKYERAQFQLASLNVKASLAGVLQAMPLELGQRVAIGGNIAKFAKKGDLIAELKVPELNAGDIIIGQHVSIDTRFNQIQGKVTRIDPAVVNGTVQVDVELTSQLPDEARPDLSIDGEIFITQKKNSLFVRRPAYSQANQTMAIYRLNNEQTTAQQTPVKFGLSSSVDIEVVNGLKVGDVIIVSEQTSFERHKLITLK